MNAPMRNSQGATQELPSNLEAEMALLGAVLMNNDAYDLAASEGLQPEHFSASINAEIFAAFGRLLVAGKSVNPVTLKGSLPSVQIGELSTSQYLARLASEAVNIVNAPDYAAAIIQAWRMRELLAVSQMMAVASQQWNDFELADEIEAIEARLDAAKAQRHKAASRHPGDDYTAAFSAAAKAKDIPGAVIGFPEIQNVLSEPTFEEGNLYGFLSSSGEGKTSLTIQLILANLKRGHPCLFLSYDQSPAQIVRQWIAQEHGIEVRRQRQPADLLSTKDQEQCLSFAKWINEQPIEIIKCGREGVRDLCGYIRGFRKRHKGNPKTAFIVLDHIGKVTPRDPRASADKISGDITVELKAIAEQTRSAIFVLNQRNSHGTRRDNPRPIAADLYGGEGARADYDAVLYLYRAEKYRAERAKIASSDADWNKINKTFGTEEAVHGKAEIGAIKVRFGDPNRTEMLKFEGRYTRYSSDPDTMKRPDRML